MTRIEAAWLSARPTSNVMTMLTRAGFQAFAVGGCVRDSLIGMPVRDIDIATDAHPEKVLALSRSAGLHAIGTGIEHGTVTVVSEGVAHEITTFRRDVATDGRRATVTFSRSIEEDARRRDFTMNALYADSQGAVFDPVGGLPDLRAQRIRFIEDAERRIREDYLRSLRFFRFHAWYGDPHEGFDPEAMAAIALHVEGLSTLSRERVGAEVLKLLAAPDPAPAVAGMRATGVLAAILPGAQDTALAPLVHLEQETETPPDALRRLAAIDGDDLAASLRLSRKDVTRLSDIRKSMDWSPGEAGYRLGERTACDGRLVLAASLGLMVDPKSLSEVRNGAAQRFPVSASDLMPGLTGSRLGQALDQMEQDWIDSGFSLDRATLLARAAKEG